MSLAYSFAGLGLVAPPVRLPEALNVPEQWKVHPHLSGFVLGALAMYTLPPFLGGVFEGARAELADVRTRQRAANRRSVARYRRGGR